MSVKLTCNDSRKREFDFFIPDGTDCWISAKCMCCNEKTKVHTSDYEYEELKKHICEGGSFK